MRLNETNKKNVLFLVGLEQATCFPSDGCRFTICDTLDTMPDVLQPEKTLM